MKKLIRRLCLTALILTIFYSKEVRADNIPTMLRTEATAYCNPKGNPTKSGNPTVEGVTLGGKKEWLGQTVAIFFVDENGEPGEFYGFRVFQDTGYGEPSEKYLGMGTSETGEVVDVYMDSYDDCMEWGRKQVYLMFMGEFDWV